MPPPHEEPKAADNANLSIETLDVFRIFLMKRGDETTDWTADVVSLRSITLSRLGLKKGKEERAARQFADEEKSFFHGAIVDHRPQ